MLLLQVKSGEGSFASRECGRMLSLVQIPDVIFEKETVSSFIFYRFYCTKSPTDNGQCNCTGITNEMVQMNGYWRELNWRLKTWNKKGTMCKKKNVALFFFGFLSFKTDGHVHEVRRKTHANWFQHTIAQFQWKRKGKINGCAFLSHFFILQI